MYLIEIIPLAKRAAFLHLTFPHYQNAFLKDVHLIAYGVYSHGTPIALIVAKQNELKGTILSLFVDPFYRNQGIGTALLKQMELDLEKRGCRTIYLRYMTKQICHLFLEKALMTCKWQQPVSQKLFMEYDISALPSELMDSHPLLQCTTSYEIFPWASLSLEELHQELGTKLYPKELSPFSELPAEPLTSFGLRYRSEIVGWIVAHRIFPDTLRYTTLWAKERREGLALMRHAIRSHFKICHLIPKALQEFSFEFPQMIHFAERKLLPYATRYYASNEAIKILK